MTAGDLVRKYWPDVREVYVSPLSHGDDVIVAWQVEVMRTGGHTEAVAAPTESEALAVMDRALSKAPRHVCGLQGFGGDPSDTCPACKARRQ